MSLFESEKRRFQRCCNALIVFYTCRYAYNGRFSLHKTVAQSFSQRKDKPPTILR